MYHLLLFSSQAPEATIEEIHTSAMRRAMQTAQPIGRELGISPQVWIDVHETGGMYHDMEDEEQCGMPRAEIESEFPDYSLPRECYKSGWYFGSREGHLGIEKRVSRVVRKLWTDASLLNELRVIAVVSHGTFMGRVVAEFLGTPAKFNHLNTSVTCIDLPANERLGVKVHYVNRVPLNEGEANVFEVGEATS